MFEYLLSEVLKDPEQQPQTTVVEQREFAAFVKTHPNIRA